MRNLTCAEISTEQKASLVLHYGLLGTREAQKVGGKNEPSKNGISSERTTGDQNQAPNRIQDEQTNNMQCSKTNFGQKLGTTQICKLGENRKTVISNKLEILPRKKVYVHLREQCIYAKNVNKIRCFFSWQHHLVSCLGYSCFHLVL